MQGCHTCHKYYCHVSLPWSCHVSYVTLWQAECKNLAVNHPSATMTTFTFHRPVVRKIVGPRPGARLTFRMNWREIAEQRKVSQEELFSRPPRTHRPKEDSRSDVSRYTFLGFSLEWTELIGVLSRHVIEKFSAVWQPTRRQRVNEPNAWMGARAPKKISS
jgi:hypothetical protein